MHLHRNVNKPESFRNMEKVSCNKYFKISVFIQKLDVPGLFQNIYSSCFAVFLWSWGWTDLKKDVFRSNGSRLYNRGRFQHVSFYLIMESSLREPAGGTKYARKNFRMSSDASVLCGRFAGNECNLRNNWF